MELGALICTPRNPQCLICPVKKLCMAFKEQRTEAWPNLGKREAATARHFVAFVVERKGKFLVRQRPAGMVNAHLWEFPNFEANGSKSRAEQIFQEQFAVEPLQLQRLTTVKHSITRYRITLESFAVSVKKFSAEAGGIWKTPAQIQQLAFTSAHKKLATLAAKAILSDR
jgi:A/G-specific adenine glycosylase